MMKRQWLTALVSLPLLVGLWWATFSLPAEPSGLTEEALGRVAESGVKNPVTAVLLNYRGYDTLLEVGVLLLALVCVWSLRSADPIPGGPDNRPLLASLLRFLLPLLVLAAGYLLWVGAFAPGGAFQGGALLAGALVLAMLGGHVAGLTRRPRSLRVGLVVGLTTFALVGTGVIVSTGGFLEYPRASAGVLILLIESTALVSIGLTLGLLFLGGSPDPQDRPSPTSPLSGP